MHLLAAKWKSYFYEGISEETDLRQNHCSLHLKIMFCALARYFNLFV
jgi:hypothetical protein